MACSRVNCTFTFTFTIAYGCNSTLLKLDLFRFQVEKMERDTNLEGTFEGASQNNTSDSDTSIV